jgi:FAD/FMN-containing dehydrogenase
VGPGNRLDGIAAKLQGTGWTFVGGRIGNTGVGGLVLGGGLSYMSTQYGWAASSVLEYELVRAMSGAATSSSPSALPKRTLAFCKRYAISPNTTPTTKRP